MKKGDKVEVITVTGLEEGIIRKVGSRTYLIELIDDPTMNLIIPKEACRRKK